MLYCLFDAYSCLELLGLLSGLAHPPGILGWRDRLYYKWTSPAIVGDIYDHGLKTGRRFHYCLFISAVRHFAISIVAHRGISVSSVIFGIYLRPLL